MEVGSTDPHAEPPSVLPAEQAAVVLQLVVILRAEGMARRCSPTDERAEHLNGRLRFIGHRRKRNAIKLKSSLIDRIGADDRGIRHLHRLAITMVVGAGGYKVEAPDSIGPDVGRLKAVAHRKLCRSHSLDGLGED